MTTTTTTSQVDADSLPQKKVRTTSADSAIAFQCRAPDNEGPFGASSFANPSELRRAGTENLRKSEVSRSRPGGRNEIRLRRSLSGFADFRGKDRPGWDSARRKSRVNRIGNGAAIANFGR